MGTLSFKRPFRPSSTPRVVFGAVGVRVGPTQLPPTNIAHLKQITMHLVRARRIKRKRALRTSKNQAHANGKCSPVRSSLPSPRVRADAGQARAKRSPHRTREWGSRGHSVVVKPTPLAMVEYSRAPREARQGACAFTTLTMCLVVASCVVKLL